MNKINAERLWQRLMDMAKIGATDNGGSCRLALSDEDIKGRNLLLSWAKPLGLSVHHDAIGNLYLRKSGLANDADPIVMGSHLDTQPKGGRFDGIFGVLAGFEVIQCLLEKNLDTHCPIELVVWTNEEGARFTPAMMGSAAFTGGLDKALVLASTDKDGISVEQELIRHGLNGNLPLKRTFSAYYEAHIEQGPILENNNNDIGVVQGGQAILWLDICSVGKAAHAGTTPMPMRKDTMVATARMIQEIEACIINEFESGVVTFGEMSIPNSSRNTIPGVIHWTIDLRNPNDGVLFAMEKRVQALIDKIALEREVSVEVKRHWYSPATPFDKNCIQTVQSTVDEFAYRHQPIISGAGHDAILLASHCPTTMIFIPCEGGLSHNEAENVQPIAVEQGGNILLNAILKYDAMVASKAQKMEQAS